MDPDLEHEPASALRVAMLGASTTLLAIAFLMLLFMDQVRAGG